MQGVQRGPPPAAAAWQKPASASTLASVSRWSQAPTASTAEAEGLRQVVSLAVQRAMSWAALSAALAPAPGRAGEQAEQDDAGNQAQGLHFHMARLRAATHIIFMTVLVLPFLDTAARDLIQAPGVPAVDFSQPRGEPALAAARTRCRGRSSRIPVTLFIGGVAAVILELAEPARAHRRVGAHDVPQRSGACGCERTGLAAMVTVYGARSVAEPMIAGVVRDARPGAAGTTPAGEAYHANDVGSARPGCRPRRAGASPKPISRYARPLDRAALDRFYAEGAPAARLYGALDMPTTDEWRAQCCSKR